jgi:hypothetical protein
MSGKAIKQEISAVGAMRSPSVLSVQGLGLLLLALLTLVTPAAVMAANFTDLEAGIDAAAARYQALGRYYAERAEAAAAASSARYQALADYHYPAADAGAARWAALGEYWTRLEAGIEASSARYSALGQFYAERAEAAAATASARYNAMGEYFAACEESAEMVCFVLDSGNR